MLLEILAFLLLGILAGIFTGLMPGIHINLIGAFIVGSSVSVMTGINPIYLAVFIVSMSIAHVFFDFIPSIFLGAPEDGTELSVLPGHELLKQGKGLHAISLTSSGCLYGVFIFLILIFPLSIIVKNITTSEIFVKLIPFFLILICLNVILMEKKKVSALFVFLISGILGLIVLNLEMKEPLLPLLMGLFGTSGILLSLNSKISFSEQKETEKPQIKKVKPILAASFFSPLSIFLPALSSGQIATIGNQFAKLGKEGFLFMLGTINALAMSFSFLALFLIEKTRTGSAVAVKSLLGVPDIKFFILIAAAILISGIVSFFLVALLSRKFISFLGKYEYKKISIAVVILTSLLTLLISGFLGLLVLAISTLTGIYCITRGVSRINMMACLLLPTIVIYLV